MSQCLRTAKNANQRTKDLINGYIRLKSKNLNIPIVINYVCLLYYLLKDRFGKHGKALKLSSDTNSKHYNIVKSKQTQTFAIWNTAYGDVDIDTNKFKDMIVNWTLKMEGYYGVIGIAPSNYSKTEGGFVFRFANDDTPGIYGWHGNTGCLRSTGLSGGGKDCGLKFGKGDTIKMELNVKEKVLKFYRNSDNNHVKIDNIDTTKIYRLAISLCWWNEIPKLTLIDSEFIP